MMTRRHAAAAVVLSALVGLAPGAAPAQEPDDEPMRRLEHFRAQRAYPFGEIPDGAYRRAYREMVRHWPRQAHRPGAAAPGAPAATTWASLGPREIRINFGSAGRISSVAVHPTDTATIYIGAASGGVWKSTDFGESWTPLTDGECSLAMGSIAIDPADPEIVYAGTGELHYSGDSYYGCGLLRSTDGGATWTKLGASIWDQESRTSGGARIGRVVVDRSAAGSATGSTVLVASDFGVHRSEDSGETWTKVLDGRFTELLQHPDADTVFFAGAGSPFDDTRNGLYRSVDGGRTWTELDSGLPEPDSAGRVQMDVAPSNPDVAYAVYQDVFDGQGDDGRLLGIWKTTDGGDSWSRIDAAGASCGNQCWYDLDIVVDPADENVVYQGGVALWKSTDGGATFQNVQNGIHVDQHNFAFDPQDPGRLYVGNDGGIYRTENGGTSWSSINNDLAITQFYSGISLHPTDTAVALGGTQDNGTLRFTGDPSWTHVIGGDGGFTAIDFVDPGNQWGETQWGGSFSGPRFSEDGGTFGQRTNGIDLSDAAQFIPPLVMSPTDPDVLYFGTRNLYRTTNQGMDWTVMGASSTFGAAGDLTAIAPSAPDPATVWVGSENSRVFVTRDDGETWTRVDDETGSSLPDRFVTDIWTDPVDPDVAWVAFSGFGTPHVWRTADGGASWEDRSGDLPDVPVNALAVHPETAGLVFAGTDLGTFRSEDGGGSWQPFNDGLPNVTVLDLAFNLTTGWLVAGTHGRGIFRAAIGEPRFPVAGEVTYYAGDTPVPGTTIRAAGGGSPADTTDAGGLYELENLVSGDTVVVTPERSGGTGVAVTAFDAATILRCVAQLEVCGGDRAVAGDVSDDGTVSSMDASLVLQRVVGLLDAFPAGEWLFDPPSRSYEPLREALVGQDFRAFAVGDVTGNWSPPGGTELLAGAAGPAGPGSMAGGRPGASAGDGALDRVASGDRGAERTRPRASGEERAGPTLELVPALDGASARVALVGRIPGEEVVAVEAVVDYDPGAWAVEGVEAGADARGHVVAHRDAAADGRLTVAAAGTEGAAEEAELLRVRLRRLSGEAGEGAAGAPLSLVSGRLNERPLGDPRGRGGGGGRRERPRTAVSPPPGAAVPDAFGLGQNYPNPFTAATGTRLELLVPDDAAAGRERRVTVTVHDVLGRRVRTLWEGELPPGVHGLRWDGTDDAGRTVASGVYLAVARRDGEGKRVRMILVR